MSVRCTNTAEISATLTSVRTRVTPSSHMQPISRKNSPTVAPTQVMVTM